MKYIFNQENKCALNPRTKEEKKKKANETLPTTPKDSQVKVQSITCDEFSSKLRENFC